MKRQLTIFLSMLLIIPANVMFAAAQNDSKQTEAQKSEEKKSGWGWKTVGSVGLGAALLAYLNYLSGEQELATTQEKIKQRNLTLSQKAALADQLSRITLDMGSNLWELQWIYEIRKDSSKVKEVKNALKLLEIDGTIDKDIKKFVEEKFPETKWGYRGIDIRKAMLQSPQFQNAYFDKLNQTLFSAISKYGELASGKGTDSEKKPDFIKQLQDVVYTWGIVGGTIPEKYR